MPHTQAQLDAMSMDELKAAISKAEAQQVADKAKGIKLGVSDKGTVMVLGLRKFPVALYPQEWEIILAPAMVMNIKQFIADNKSKLSFK